MIFYAGPAEVDEFLLLDDFLALQINSRILGLGYQTGQKLLVHGKPQ